MWKKIIFDRTGGHWLFWMSAIYLATGLYCALYYKEIPTALIQVVWLLAIAMPFYFPPLGRWLNMSVDWDKNMFDFFRNKTSKDSPDDAKDNVYTLPKLVETPKPAPKKEEPAKIFYRLGLTDNNRVAFQMGYSEITMSAQGCQQMIDQLEFFKSQLYDEGGPTDDPDGGLPLPEEQHEQKAA